MDMQGTEQAKMLDTFAVINEELRIYLAGFNIARELFRRTELPPDGGKPMPLIPESVIDVMDFIFQKKSEGLPLAAYKEEEEYGASNLEELIRLAIKDSVSNLNRGKTKTVELRDRTVEAVSFEHDIKSPISHYYRRVKGMPSFWRKSMCNVDSQSETGFHDLRAFTIIVESPQAREYRARRKLENLSNEEQQAYRRKFGLRKVEQLTPEEREEYYRMFARDFKYLTPAEQREYRDKFQEMHRKLCRDLAKKIALSQSFATIPIKPHYMALGSLELRVQRQVITDPKGRTFAEFEYILRRGDGSDLFEKVLRSASDSIIEIGEGFVKYLDHEGRESYLVNHEPLVINFHLYKAAADLDIKLLSDKIKERYGYFSALFRGKYPEIGKDELDFRVMQTMRLGMEDIPLGLCIIAETTTRDLERDGKKVGKYTGMSLDERNAFDMFIKDRTKKDQKPSNEYEDLKFYLSLGKQISAECQIMCPIMEYEAQFGKASGFRDPDEHIAEWARRSWKPVKPLTTEDIRFGAAFFHSDDTSREHFFELYARFYSMAVLNAIHEIRAMPDAAKEQNRFDDLFERVKLLCLSAKERLAPQGIEQVVAAVNSIFDVYLGDKGGSVLAYRRNLLAVNERLRQAEEELKAFASGEEPEIKFTYFNGEKELSLDLHKRHLALLYQAYEKLAKSGNARQVAASLIFARLIKDYLSHYPGSVPQEVQYEYRKKLEGFRADNGLERYHIRRETIGYVPGWAFKKGGIEKAFGDPEILSVSQAMRLPIRNFNFDTGTMDKLRGIYDGLSGKLKR
ncbi:hypothetical protein HY637_05075 [Candidatus Woesearchaeota archaeon]|nr:hypothetical protein [Candidatus Woesearchaeota archaeon]